MGGGLHAVQDCIGRVPHAGHAREYWFSKVDQARNIAGAEVVLRGSRFLHVANSKKSAQAREALVARSKRGPPIIGMVAQKPAHSEPRTCWITPPPSRGCVQCLCADP